MSSLNRIIINKYHYVLKSTPTFYPKIAELS
ncbi:hypothetical protein MY11210_008640 [Beauveria gryllotalpidicola]